VEDASESFDEACQLLEHAQASHSKDEQGLKPVEDARDEAKQRLDKSKVELLEIQAEQRTIKGHVDVAKQQVTMLTAKIEAERKRLEAAHGGSQATRLAAIREAELATAAAKQAMDEHQTRLPQLTQDKQESDKAFGDFQPTLDAKRTEVDIAEQKLRSLKQNRSDPLAGYPGNLSNVLRAINNETRFRDKPVGPLGMHITLLNPEWSSILEKTFGGSLNSFVVTSKQDQRVLSEILQRTGR